MEKRAIRGLYLVTDRGLVGDRALQEVVEQAVAGGVSWVQIREKDATTQSFLAEALALKPLLARHNVPLIINDRLDVALAVEADGVHIGRDDMPYPVARKLLGPHAWIGLSVETPEHVLAANDYDVDYIALSPIYATPTKTDTRTVWGSEGVRWVRKQSRHPLVAIGGLHAGNVALVVEAGADCVAVVSAVCAALDPRQAAAELVASIDAALAKRV